MQHKFFFCTNLNLNLHLGVFWGADYVSVVIFSKLKMAEGKVKIPLIFVKLGSLHRLLRFRYQISEIKKADLIWRTQSLKLNQFAWNLVPRGFVDCRLRISYWIFYIRNGWSNIANVKQTNQPIYLKLGCYAVLGLLITNPLSDFRN